MATSLYKYLLTSEQIIAPSKKEIHYFDLNYDKRDLWYLKQFKINKKLIGKKSGEASPYYLYHPLVPERIYKFNRNIKLIVLLRDPVERAFSHYKMVVEKDYEKGSFEKGIEKEKLLLPKANEEILRGAINKFHQFGTYIDRCKYVEQLKRWGKYFDLENMYITSSENFFENTQEELNNIFEYIGIEKVKVNVSKVFNKGNKSSQLNEKTRAELIEFYKPYNKELFELLGKKFEW